MCREPVSSRRTRLTDSRQKLISFEKLYQVFLNTLLISPPHLPYEQFHQILLDAGLI